MRKLMLATTALIALSAPAGAAAILHLNDNRPPDPASFTEPVLIQSQTQFFIQQTSNTATAGPLYLYILDYPGGITPSVTSAKLNGNDLPAIGVTNPITLDGHYTLGNGQDSFYKSYLNCNSGCDGSISDSNISQAYQDNFSVGAPLTFDVYKITINGGFPGNDYYEINGVFGKGSVIAPFMADGPAVTSWTNAGLITGGTCLGCGPTPQAVPGPIVGAGLPGLVTACLTLLGLARQRRKSTAV